MPILNYNDEYYRYGSDQVSDKNLNSLGYMAFVAPATDGRTGEPVTAVSFLLYQFPPGPVFDSPEIATEYARSYLLLNLDRLANGTGFPVGARVGNRKTRAIGRVVAGDSSVMIGITVVDLENGGNENMETSLLVLVPETA